MRIDLNVKVVTPSTRIWVAFPGRRRRFLDEVRTQERIFLELPYMQMDPSTEYSDIEITKRIRRSIELRQHLDNIASGRSSSPPDMDLEAYRNTDNDGAVSVMFGCLKSLMFKMTAGDLLLIPGKGSYGEVIFGEVTDEYNSNSEILIDRFKDYPVVSRRFKTLKVIPERRILPREIAEHLGRPPSIHEIKRGLQPDRVFAIAYDSYISKISTETTINAPRYNGRNPTHAIALQQLSAALGAVYFAQQADIDARQLKGLTAQELIDRYLPDDSFLDYEFGFASPGYIRLRPKDAALALFIAGALSLTIYGLGQIPGSAQIITVNSSGSIGDNIRSEVDESLNYLAHSITPELQNEFDS